MGASETEKNAISFGLVWVAKLAPADEIAMKRQLGIQTAAQWIKTAKNWDGSTGPIARSFARSLAPITYSLAPHCSLCSRAPLRSFVRSFVHSLTPKLVGNMGFDVGFNVSKRPVVLSHSASADSIDSGCKDG